MLLFSVISILDFFFIYIRKNIGSRNVIVSCFSFGLFRDLVYVFFFLGFR